MIKKILLAALWLPLMALAQSYPSPTYQNVTILGTLNVATIGLTNPLPVASGGTGRGTASGTSLDNITGFSSTGFISRTGAGAYSFTGSTGSGGNVVLSTSPSIATPTVTGSFTATGLVTTSDLATQAANTVLANATASSASPTAIAMPSCNSVSQALQWTSGTGFACNSAITTSVLNGTATFTANPTIGAATFYPTVANNAALQALSTATTSTVWRLGFTTAGDAPPLLYTSSASACSLNSGAGDNGSQVQSSNSKCWIASFGPGPADVREWGAKGDGSTNNTTAMQAAHNTGLLIYYPAGNYNFTTISFSKGGIVGDGEAYTYLNSTDTTTANVITFSAVNLQPGTNAPLFQKFTLQGQGSKTTGAGILVTAPSSENQGARFENVTVYTFPTDLQFGAASNWSIQNSNFINYLNSGVTIANTNNPDSGDSVIAGSLFVTSVGSSPVGINYQSSGGLKVVGNKFNGGAYGFFLGLNAPANTSILLISDNSIENQTTAAIELSRQSGTATFTKITISNNELGINPNGIATDASGAIGDVAITGNVIDLTSTTTGACISLGNVTTFAITNNTCVGNGGTPSGIVVQSASSNGKIGKNTYKSLTTTLNNASTTTFYDRDKQVVSVSVSTSGAYGSLFVGSAAQTFPTAFTVAPAVVCTPTSTGTGAVAAIPTSITASGFTLNVVGLNNTSSIPVTCEADGVI